MSFLASVIKFGIKLSEMKKMFGKPEEELLKIIDKMNKNRGFYMPNDKKFIYSKRMIFDKYPCLVVQNEKKAFTACRSVLFRRRNDDRFGQRRCGCDEKIMP